MTTYFVTRHPGAVDWAKAQGIEARQVVDFSPAQVGKGDVVLGVLPVHLAAQTCRRGAQYWHLELDTPPEFRGKELCAETMARLGARLRRYHIEEIIE